jgi:hypothetical protein
MVNVVVLDKIRNIKINTSVVKMKSTNVVVANKRNVLVSADATMGLINSTTPVTIINTPTLISMGATSLGQLNDIDLTNKTQGATLVYESSNNSYVLKNLDMGNITGGLKGGTF